jgi:hypothetical protein
VQFGLVPAFAGGASKFEGDRDRRRDPSALYQNDNNRDFFSVKVGCQTYQPIYGMDLAALCVRG